MRQGARVDALSTFPRSSPSAEIDGVMRLRGWRSQKMTACRASASTGVKNPLFDWCVRRERGKHASNASSRANEGLTYHAAPVSHASAGAVMGLCKWRGGA